MKALKGLMIYVGIVLAMILGIGIILFAIMYFVPSFRLFGVGVVHISETVEDTKVPIDEYYGCYSQIELNLSSKRIKINLEALPEIEDIQYNLKMDVFGIAYDITEYKIIKNLEVKDSVLKVNLTVTEPNGLISDNGSVLNVYVPENTVYNGVINTTSADVQLKGIKLDRLSVTTTSGNMNVYELGTMISDVRYLILDSLNLTTDTGNFDMSSITQLNVKSPIKINAKDGNFKFYHINGGIDVTGKGVKLNANTINTDSDGFRFISENGFFEIEKIITATGAENTIVTENCDVKINEITGKTGIVTTYGNINVGTFNSSAILESEHGNVNVTNAKEDIRITTEFGNIKVNSYLKNARFISKKGNIDVKSTGDYIQGVYTQIDNVDGEIIADNKINRLIVNTTGSSKVTVTYREIKGGLENPEDVFQHKVNLSNYSSATIYMPTTNYKTPFKFIAKGNISGEISGLISEYEGGEVKSSDDFQFFPSASAEFQAECQKSCYFEFLGTIVFKGYVNR